MHWPPVDYLRAIKHDEFLLNLLYINLKLSRVYFIKYPAQSHHFDKKTAK